MAADERFSEEYLRAGDHDPPLGVRNEIITGPVSDWATDFSHLEPEWAADPYRIQDDLRQRCPIAHTARFGGARLGHRPVPPPVDHPEHLPAPPRVRADRRLAADLLRPALPPRRAQAPA